MAVWNAPGETRIILTRDFLKRLRGIFDVKGKPFTLAAHTGGGLDIHTLGLTNFFWEGEQLARYLPQYWIPHHEYAIGIRVRRRATEHCSTIIGWRDGAKIGRWPTHRY